MDARKTPNARLGVADPRWHFDPRDYYSIVDYPFDGMEVAEWSYGDHELSVVYDRGWWFQDNRRALRCRSLRRAMTIFWRRARAIYGV